MGVLGGGRDEWGNSQVAGRVWCRVSSVVYLHSVASFVFIFSILLFVSSIKHDRIDECGGRGSWPRVGGEDGLTQEDALSWLGGGNGLARVEMRQHSSGDAVDGGDKYVEVVVGMGGGTGAREERDVAMGVGFI